MERHEIVIVITIIIIMIGGRRRRHLEIGTERRRLKRIDWPIDTKATAA